MVSDLSPKDKGDSIHNLWWDKSADSKNWKKYGWSSENEVQSDTKWAEGGKARSWKTLKDILKIFLSYEQQEATKGFQAKR